MRKLIKKILKEDFDWIDDIPSTMGPEDLIPGVGYKITWDDDEWLGMFKNKGIKSGDVFKYVRNNGSAYYFKHPNHYMEIAVPIDDQDRDSWTPQEYGIIVLPAFN